MASTTESALRGRVAELEDELAALRCAVADERFEAAAVIDERDATIATLRARIAELEHIVAAATPETIADRDERIAALTARIHELEHIVAVVTPETIAQRDRAIAELKARVASLERKLVKSTRQIIGPKTERMPTPEQEAKNREGEPPARGGNTNPKKRAENAEALASLPTCHVPHPIAEEDRRCPHCGEPVRPIGDGDTSVEYEWIPGRLERRNHVVETGRCPCKLHYARGPAPERVHARCAYGPGFISKLVVDKCADAIPIHRIEKAMRRMGMPISRSTMNDLLLLAGELCLPLWEAAFVAMRKDPHVQADETSFRLQGHEGRVFVWTFLASNYCVYVFSEDRSGDTPREVLGGTTGSLTVDGYTGYNNVTTVDGRERTGCWSHARRYLFDALAYAPEAREALDLILELFMIERTAARKGIVGTDEHLALRRRRGLPVLGNILRWMKRTADVHEPRSAMGEALRYMQNQWFRLTAFLDDAQIPIHNNASEAALRIIALARKNSLFFGNVRAAKRLMVLYSLVAMCEMCGVNPEAYFTDVLLRLQDHPKHRVAELLPHEWKKTFGSAYRVEHVVAPAEAA